MARSNVHYIVALNLPESCLLNRKVCRMAFCLEKTFVLNNLGSEDEAVFFWRTVCIEAGSVNKRGGIGVD